MASNVAQVPSPQKFFIKLFEMRDVIHFTHIAQPDRSLATHLALGEIYEAITPIIDGLIEGWSGLKDQQVRIVSGGAAVDDPLKYLIASYDYLALYSYIFNESWILNELDEISKTLAIGIYKLRFVK